MVHKTTVEMTAPDVMRKRMTEAVVSLYRRSQNAGDEGRLFIFQDVDHLTNTQHIGLLRTSDDSIIAGLMAMRSLSNIRELDEDEILQLFEAS